MSVTVPLCENVTVLFPCLGVSLYLSVYHTRVRPQYVLSMFIWSVTAQFHSTIPSPIPQQNIP